MSAVDAVEDPHGDHGTHSARRAQARWHLLGAVPLQGNIDPALLAAGSENLYAHVDEVLAEGNAAPSHVVNLGHGVPPTTNPQVLTDLVAYIHEKTAH